MVYLVGHYCSGTQIQTTALITKNRLWPWLLIVDGNTVSQVWTKFWDNKKVWIPQVKYSSSAIAEVPDRGLKFWYSSDYNSGSWFWATSLIPERVLQLWYSSMDYNFCTQVYTTALVLEYNWQLSYLSVDYSSGTWLRITALIPVHGQQLWYWLWTTALVIECGMQY